MSQTKYILIGGFLGAGKTTLIGRIARSLTGEGKRVGIVTNDQASSLVDTQVLKGPGIIVQEIAGGCFCCKFSDLIAASDKIVEEVNPYVLIGEPVGSCTDISATVLQPLKKRFADKFSLGPFCVLADPHRLREVLDPDSSGMLHPSARYIVRKQLEEADAIMLNKIDLLSNEELDLLQAEVEKVFPSTRIFRISALRGDGVDEWFDFAMNSDISGGRVVDVDYRIHAEAEAMLGWLNASVQLLASEQIDWKRFCLDLMNNLQSSFEATNSEIAHLKLILDTASGQYIAANLTSSAGEPYLRGEVDSSFREAELTINARVQASPDELNRIVEDNLKNTAGSSIEARIIELSSRSPGRPKPTYRYEAVV